MLGFESQENNRNGRPLPECAPVRLLLAWGQVGALEYDPELPARQRHREWLAERVVFKEVVPIADGALRAKIHQTYRLAYIKDVVLPRVLDDATFATFSSLILFNNVEARNPPAGGACCMCRPAGAARHRVAAAVQTHACCCFVRVCVGQLRWVADDQERPCKHATVR